MILINVRFTARPEHAEDFPELVRPFTEATRAEPGNLWFDWSRSLDDPAEYVLIEAFQDDAAEAHVQSAHFQQATKDFPQWLAETPRIINTTLEGDDWSRMAEFQVD